MMKPLCSAIASKNHQYNLLNHPIESRILNWHSSRLLVLGLYDTLSKAHALLHIED